MLREFKVERGIYRCHKFCKQVGSSRLNQCGYRKLEWEIALALKFLASASQNLEVLQLTFRCEENQSRELSNALQDLLKKSPKLKFLHCKVAFKLKVLRNCKQLESILLHFIPKEPWYNFLEKENGLEESFKMLDSLEIFTICREKDIELSEEIVSEYIVILLMHCPSLTSLGRLETSRALAQLHRKGISLQLKLRSCHWNKDKWIRDAVTYHPLVEELDFFSRSVRSIKHLSKLKNLVSLSLWISVERDISVLLYNILKDIGGQLKYLSLWFFKNTVDISMQLKNCPNLEALQFCATEYCRYAEPAIRLPNLKYLSLTGINKEVQRVLRLFADCHNVTELFLNGHGFDDETLDEFLKKNSFTNLKIALFIGNDLTKQGFKKFLLNATNLEKVHARNNRRGQPKANELKGALIETRHRAVSTNFCVSSSDDFFIKNSMCYA